MANTFFYQWLRAGMSIAAVLLTFTGCVMAGKPTAEYFEGQHRVAARAIDDNNIDELRRTASQIDDLDALGRDGITLLFYAYVKENMAAISALIELGADPTVGNAAAYPDTATPLDVVLMFEDARYLVAMLDGGLSPDYQIDYKPTPGRPPVSFTTPLIMKAAISGRHHIPLLLERGANINAANSSGRTVLNDAMSVYTHPDFIIDLILRGADVNTSSNNGMTPAWKLERILEDVPPNDKWRSKWEEVRDLMIEHGAQWPPDPPDKVREQRRAQGLPTIKERERRTE